MRIVTGIVFWAATLPVQAEGCHFALDPSALERREIDGQTVYLVPAAKLARDNCLDVQTISQAYNGLRADLEQCHTTVNQGLAWNESAGRILDDAKQLSDTYQSALDNAISVSSQYQALANEYGQLATRYDSLTHQFDRLAGDYRNLLSPSSLSIELGVGYGGGAPMGLIGVGTLKYRLWGIAQEGNNSILVGTSFNY